jgi:signal transduction histidine kinase
MAPSMDQHRLLADLHDGLGQELFAISMMLQAQVKTAAGCSMLEKELKYLLRLTKHAVQTLRDITGSSIGFEKTELVRELRRMARTLSRTTGVRVRFRTRGASRYSMNGSAASHLYRIAQEASTNALRHSGARHIILELIVTKHEVRLRIVDDGRGVRGRGYTGLGLHSMTSRAAALGGILTVERGNTAGTVVTCVYQNGESPTARRT